MQILFCGTQGKLETVPLRAPQTSLNYTVKGIHPGLRAAAGRNSWGATHIQSYCMNGFWSRAEALHLDYPMVSRETQRDRHRERLKIETI